MSLLLLLAVLLNIASCSLSRHQLQHLNQLVKSWDVQEKGMLTPEVLQELSLVASNGGPKGSSIVHDAITTLFEQKNTNPLCYALLIEKGVYVSFRHLHQALKIKNRAIFQVLLGGKHKEGILVANHEWCFANLLVKQVELSSVDQIHWILEAYPGRMASSDVMGSAIASGNVDIMLAILPRQHFISADWISFAIVKCQDTRLLSALVKRGINPNFDAHGGKLPLVSAVSKLGDAVGLFKELAEAGASLERSLLTIYDEVLLQPNLSQRLHLLVLLCKNIGKDHVSNLELRKAIEELGHGYEVYKLLIGNFLMTNLPVEIRRYLLQLMLHNGLLLLLA